MGLEPTTRGVLVGLVADGEFLCSAGGKLVKTQLRQRFGQRWSDPSELPAEKAGYALRDLHRLIATCAGHGQSRSTPSECRMTHCPGPAAETEMEASR